MFVCGVVVFVASAVVAWIACCAVDWFSAIWVGSCGGWILLILGLADFVLRWCFWWFPFEFRVWC